MNVLKVLSLVELNKKKMAAPTNEQPFLFISYALALYTNVGVSTLAPSLLAAL